MTTPYAPPPAGPQFYITVDEDPAARPYVVERPTGLLTIVRLRRGLPLSDMCLHGLAALDPEDQNIWRSVYGIPPWPADPRVYFPTSMTAVPELIHPSLQLPHELQGGSLASA